MADPITDTAKNAAGAAASGPTGIIGSIINLINTILEYMLSSRREIKVMKAQRQEAEDKLKELDGHIKEKTLAYEDVGELYIKRKELVETINKLNEELKGK